MVTLNFKSANANTNYAPEAFAHALAHVIRYEGGEEKILGQCWLAGPGQLITCGHVVQPYIAQLQTLTVRFPDSGNRYDINSVQLHPSFLRQADQLVKFDVAVLEIQSVSPERFAAPMPITFGRRVGSNQAAWTVRFPVHIGNISAAPSPLIQKGLILGPLRKFDEFHLLHDLALAPGDSGAPILHGNRVVALHCGDTASLPGLNLPTTSIRLALWIDALRELNIKETAPSTDPATRGEMLFVGATFFLVALLISFTITLIALSFSGQLIREIAMQPSQSTPIEIRWETDSQDSAKSDLLCRTAPKYKMMLFALQGNNAETLLPSSFLTQDANEGMQFRLASSDLDALRSEDAEIFVLVTRSGVQFNLHTLGAKEIKSDAFTVPRDALFKFVGNLEASYGNAVVSSSIELKTSPNNSLSATPL